MYFEYPNYQSLWVYVHYKEKPFHYCYNKNEYNQLKPEKLHVKIVLHFFKIFFIRKRSLQTKTLNIQYVNYITSKI